MDGEDKFICMQTPHINNCEYTEMLRMLRKRMPEEMLLETRHNPLRNYEFTDKIHAKHMYKEFFNKVGGFRTQEEYPIAMEIIKKNDWPAENFEELEDLYQMIYDSLRWTELIGRLEASTWRELKAELDWQQTNLSLNKNLYTDVLTQFRYEQHHWRQKAWINDQYEFKTRYHGMEYTELGDEYQYLWFNSFLMRRFRKLLPGRNYNDISDWILTRSFQIGNMQYADSENEVHDETWWQKGRFLETDTFIRETLLKGTDLYEYKHSIRSHLCDIYKELEEHIDILGHDTVGRRSFKDREIETLWWGFWRRKSLTTGIDELYDNVAAGMLKYGYGRDVLISEEVSDDFWLLLQYGYEFQELYVNSQNVLIPMERVSLDTRLLRQAFEVDRYIDYYSIRQLIRDLATPKKVGVSAKKFLHSPFPWDHKIEMFEVIETGKTSGWELARTILCGYEEDLKALKEIGVYTDYYDKMLYMSRYPWISPDYEPIGLEIVEQEWIDLEEKYGNGDYIDDPVSVHDLIDLGFNYSEVRATDFGGYDRVALDAYYEIAKDFFSFDVLTAYFDIKLGDFLADGYSFVELADSFKNHLFADDEILAEAAWVERDRDRQRELAEERLEIESAVRERGVFIEENKGYYGEIFEYELEVALDEMRARVDGDFYEDHDYIGGVIEGIEFEMLDVLIEESESDVKMLNMKIEDMLEFDSGGMIVSSVIDGIVEDVKAEDRMIDGTVRTIMDKMLVDVYDRVHYSTGRDAYHVILEELEYRVVEDTVEYLVGSIEGVIIRDVFENKIMLEVIEDVRAYLLKRLGEELIWDVDFNVAQYYFNKSFWEEIEEPVIDWLVEQVFFEVKRDVIWKFEKVDARKRTHVRESLESVVLELERAEAEAMEPIIISECLEKIVSEVERGGDGSTIEGLDYSLSLQKIFSSTLFW